MPPSTLVENEEPEEPQGALETGLWCGRCLLPSAIRWPVVQVDMTTGSAIPIGSAIACFDCGWLVDEEGNPIRHA